MDNLRLGLRKALAALQRPRRSSSAAKNDLLQRPPTDPDYKWMGGRRFNGIKGLAYVLPNDSTEVDRLIGQHYLVKEVFGSLFRAPVEDLVKEGAIVLDVGCEMATQYPDSQFLGLDISDYFPHDIKPANSTFAVCNVVKGLSEYEDNTFDYIFQRFMVPCYTKEDWNFVIKELHRILKPGGYLECWEMDAEAQCRGPESTSVDKRSREAMEQRGLDPLVARRLTSIFALSGLTCVQSVNRSVPLGWDDSMIGKLQMQLAREEARSLRPFITKVFNISPEDYDASAERGFNECAEYHTYINYVAAYGKKATGH
ncbi:S-adenosyl-L-methionine-dependent methyltransferase [Jimgerdemannia flammicorona]|uniref:S-adenosyl-L-methionine-dependent methyltransferase n=1 Tax=Jimgerdemannia flammicorona TaxID=994334 RepID=A0A433QQN4_9FUNG|nr:S-adenosyl-L-methionine-dependent methyltransferase [Jimgerdemannia flammicorona]